MILIPARKWASGEVNWQLVFSGRGTSVSPASWVELPFLSANLQDAPGISASPTCPLDTSPPGTVGKAPSGGWASLSPCHLLDPGADGAVGSVREDTCAQHALRPGLNGHASWQSCRQVPVVSAHPLPLWPEFLQHPGQCLAGAGCAVNVLALYYFHFSFSFLLVISK